MTPAGAGRPGPDQIGLGAVAVASMPPPPPRTPTTAPPTTSRSSTDPMTADPTPATAAVRRPGAMFRARCCNRTSPSIRVPDDLRRLAEAQVGVERGGPSAVRRRAGRGPGRQRARAGDRDPGHRGRRCTTAAPWPASIIATCSTWSATPLDVRPGACRGCGSVSRSAPASRWRRSCTVVTAPTCCRHDGQDTRTGILVSAMLSALLVHGENLGTSPSTSCRPRPASPRPPRRWPPAAGRSSWPGVATSRRWRTSSTGWSRTGWPPARPGPERSSS